MSTTRKTKQMVLTALFSAIIIVMTFVPYIGYISYGPLSLSITTIHVAVIIGAVMLGPIGGTVLGTVWGVTCLINAFFINPIEGAIFQNPLISVLPRIIVGFVVGYLAMLLSKAIKSSYIVSIISALIGTLTNTVLVLTAIDLFNKGTLVTFNKTLTTIIKTIVSINGGIELIIALILVPIIVAAIRRAQH